MPDCHLCHGRGRYYCPDCVCDDFPCETCGGRRELTCDECDAWRDGEAEASE